MIPVKEVMTQNVISFREDTPVDEVVTVNEDEIAEAVRVAWSRLHLALEPTGALPLAAYLAGKLPGGRTGLILSGGNANLETVATLLRTQ